jgi:hypothetical protein
MNTQRHALLALGAMALAVSGAVSAGAADPGREPIEVEAPVDDVRAGAAVDPAGRIFGTVETESGARHTGFLRWGREEAFWDDLFHATKRDLGWLEKYLGDERRRSEIRVFGITIGHHWETVGHARLFVARFGDIAEIEPRGDGRVELTMRDGTVHDLDGGSNDVGGVLTVDDAALGQVKLDWDEIEHVVFAPAPAHARPSARRLHGTLRTRTESFEGFIQWDSEECLDTDRLDGESEDGDLSIEMGRIRAIEKHDDDGSWVELVDGRRLLVEDTNDVDESIRGIMVEDGRFGRVEVSWSAFERVELHDTRATGRSYEAYAAGRPLRGEVTAADGRKWSGRLVFDLDEAATWELLDGERDGVEYHVPFERVRSVERLGGGASRVVLRGGGELVLEESQDVGDDNDGVMILPDDGGPGEVYVPWQDVGRVDLD